MLLQVFACKLKKNHFGRQFRDLLLSLEIKFHLKKFIPSPYRYLASKIICFNFLKKLKLHIKSSTASGSTENGLPTPLLRMDTLISGVWTYKSSSAARRTENGLPTPSLIINTPIWCIHIVKWV